MKCNVNTDEEETLPVAPQSLMLLEPDGGKLQMVCLLNNVLLYNIILPFPGSSSYLDELCHTVI